jgi:hypothetical protein
MSGNCDLFVCNNCNEKNSSSDNKVGYAYQYNDNYELIGNEKIIKNENFSNDFCVDCLEIYSFE